MNKKIAIDLVKYIVLESSTEDMTSLYEVIWELNAKFPDVEKKEKLEVSRIAIQSLLGSGHLRLFKKFRTAANEERVDNNEWSEILNQDKHWDPPSEDGLYYCFFQTETTSDELWKQYERSKNTLQ
jgi:hypothetical protein